MEPLRLTPTRHLLTSQVVAILRGSTGEHIEAVIDTLVAQDVTCLEITNNTPGALAAVARAAARLGDRADIGLGTVRRAAQVDAAARAGARFIVCPTTSAEVGRRAKQLGLAWLPGALTPTEVDLAWQLGATAVKVFPASLGGPGYIQELRAPLDDVLLVPTGGVAIDDVPRYLAAGALAVGLGSPLVGDALTTGDLAGVATRARSLRAALETAA